jgi:PAS domain S-box-containing protein
VIVDADVTSANVMALAERMSVDLSHRLADHVPVPLWSMTPEGRILFANQAWWQAAGLSDGGSTDPTAWLDAMHPDDRQAASSALAIAVSYRQRFEVELRLQAGDGTYRWWSIVGVPRSAADGSVESLLGIATDVTRARHAQQALRQLGAKLVAAQEAERRRIAGELHDDLGQQVMLLASKLTAARQERASLRTLQASITEAWQDVQEIASSIHNLAHQLHPARLQLFGLVQTLEMLCRDVSTETGLRRAFRPISARTPRSVCSAWRRRPSRTR